MNRLIIQIAESYRKIIKSRLLLFVTVILPISVSVLYGLIYSREVAENIPVGVVDYDRSELSRKLANMFAASPSIKIIDEFNSTADIQREMLAGKIEAGIVIPRKFEKSLKSGKYQTIVVYKNSQNIIVGNILLKEAATITQTFSAQAFAQKLISKGISKANAAFIANPVVVRTQSLFNANYSYLRYLVPGLILFTLQLSAIISGVLIVGNDKKGAHKNLLKYKFVVLYFHNLLINSAVIYALMPLINIPLPKQPGTVALLTAINLLAVMLIGFAAGIFTKIKMTALEIVIFYTTPAFIFSGFTFPIWGMPLIHRYYAALIPFTYYLEAYLRTAIMGSPIEYITSQIVALSLFAALTLIVLTVRFNQQKNKNENTEEYGYERVIR